MTRKIHIERRFAEEVRQRSFELQEEQRRNASKYKADPHLTCVSLAERRAIRQHLLILMKAFGPSANFAIWEKTP